MLLLKSPFSSNQEETFRKVKSTVETNPFAGHAIFGNGHVGYVVAGPRPLNNDQETVIRVSDKVVRRRASAQNKEA